MACPKIMSCHAVCTEQPVYIGRCSSTIPQCRAQVFTNVIRIHGEHILSRLLCVNAPIRLFYNFRATFCAKSPRFDAKLCHILIQSIKFTHKRVPRQLPFTNRFSEYKIVNTLFERFDLPCVHICIAVIAKRPAQPHVCVCILQAKKIIARNPALFRLHGIFATNSVQKQLRHVSVNIVRKDVRPFIGFQRRVRYRAATTKQINQRSTGWQMIDHPIGNSRLAAFIWQSVLSHIPSLLRPFFRAPRPHQRIC